MATPSARSRGHGVGAVRVGAQAAIHALWPRLHTMAAIGVPTPAITVPKVSPAPA